MNDLSRSQLGYSGQQQQIKDINDLQFNENNFKLLKSMLIVRLQQQDSESKLKLLDSQERQASQHNSQISAHNSQQTPQQYHNLAENDNVKQLIEMTSSQENHSNQQLRHLISKYGFTQSRLENPFDCLDRSINYTISQLNYYKMKCQELLLDYTELQYKEALSDVVSKMVESMNKPNR